MYLREFAVEQLEDVELWLDLGGWRSAEFERAVRAVASQAFELNRRGLRVTLRTQECEIAVPEQQDIYGLLKYLALVEAEPLARPFTGTALVDASQVLLYTPAKERAPAALLHRTICPGEPG